MKKYDFQFTDRDNERKLIKEYIKKSNVENALWVYGESGIGKSELVKHTLKETNSWARAFYLENLNNEPYVSMLKRIIVPKGSYKEALLSTATTSIDILDSTGYINKSVGLIGLFLKAYKAKKSDAKILFDLYKKYMHSNKLDIVVIDDLQSVVDEEFTIVAEFINFFLEDSKIKKIIITRSSNNVLNNPIDNFLFDSSYNIKHLSLKKLEDSKYFQIILYNFILDFEPFRMRLDELYDKCCGNPGKLKELIRYVVRENALYDTSKTINENNINISISDFFGESKANNFIKSANYYSKVVFVLIGIIRIKLCQDTLTKLIKFVLEKINFNIISIEDIQKSIIELFSYDFIKHNQTYMIYIDEAVFNDTLVNLQFLDSNRSQIHRYIYSFLIKNRGIFLDECSYYDYLESLSYHSTKSLDETIAFENNIRLSNYLIKHDEMKLLINVADRMINCDFQITDDLKLIFSLSYYLNGHYNKAKEILDSISEENTKTDFKFLFYITLGKTHHMLLNQTVAVKKFKEAIDLSKKDSDEYFYSSNLYVMSLSEISGSSKESKTLFLELAKHITQNSIKSLYAISVLRNSINFVSGDDSIFYLNKALEISKILPNEDIEYSKILHNIGFEYFRSGNTVQAYKNTSKALTILDKRMKHETSYCLNNLGVVELANRNFDKALDYFKLGLIWNKSYYGEFVLTTNLMLANAYLKNDIEFENCKTQLENMLEKYSEKDYRIYRKALLNIGISMTIISKEQYKTDIIEILKRTSCFLENSNSILRYNEYAKKYNLNLIDFKKSVSQNFLNYYKILDFEPWLLTFSHD